jgi:hypothetical protein
MRKIKVFALFTVLACGAGVALPCNAWAQGFNVKNFSCSSTSPFSVNVDVSGLGNTNLCVTGSAIVDLACACVGGGGNCTSDAKKATTPITTSTGQSFQAKNGRVVTTVSLPISLTDGSCTEPQCGSGQITKLIKFATEGTDPTFSVCTTTAPPGTACSCTGSAVLDTIACGPTGATIFAGKKNSCSKLF